MRHIDSVLTDDNLRMLGLIETNQSIVIEGLAKPASKTKKKKVERKPSIVIREMSDDERAPTDTELAADLTRIEEKRKGKAVVPKLKRRKSAVVSRLIPGITTSDAAPCQSRNIFIGLDDIPIPEYVSLHHESGLDELREALEISEPLPVSVVDTSDWSGVLHICIHFHNTTRLLYKSYCFRLVFNRIASLFQLICLAVSLH